MAGLGWLASAWRLRWSDFGFDVFHRSGAKLQATQEFSQLKTIGAG